VNALLGLLLAIGVVLNDAIFEPFYRSRGATSADGTGLGLGIAREIARSHGGDVVLDASWPGKGARFVLQLPNARGSTNVS
jgi:signal transduction histidine kinase